MTWWQWVLIALAVVFGSIIGAIAMVYYIFWDVFK